MSENDKKKYRNEWYEYQVNLLESMKDKSKLNENFYLDSLNDYWILTQLANIEIDLDELEKNKCLAKANMGLDCASITLSSMLDKAIEYSDPQKISKLMSLFEKKIHDIDESMLSETYKNQKNDDKLESFLL